MKAWKGFLLRYSGFDGFSLFTMKLGLKYYSLSLPDWNNWPTISGTITWVLFEAYWSKLWLCFTLGVKLNAEQLQVSDSLSSGFWILTALEGEEKCSTCLGEKARCQWFRSRHDHLTMSEFLFDAWAELSPPAKSRVKRNNLRVDLSIMVSFLCSYIKKSWESEIHYRGCYLQGS